MAVNIGELIRQAPEILNFASLSESDENKEKMYGTIINMMNSHTTKLSALQKLHDLIELSPTELPDYGSKLFVSLNRIVTKQSEPTNIRLLASQCLVCVVKVSADGGDLQKEVAAAVPSLVNSILHSGCPDIWVPLLAQIMKTFPGPCGPIRTQIMSSLSGLVGRGVVKRTQVGGLFVLYPQLGGGGREGVEHSRNFAMLWDTVTNTVNKLLNTFFKYIQGEGQPGNSGGDVLSLEPVGGTGVAAYLTKFAQLLDLMEIQCSMLTSPFPQSREIRCEEVIEEALRILQVSEASIKQRDIPELELLRLLLPSLHVQALQLLQALIVSVGEDIVPEVATLNNILIKTLTISKSSKVREALYDTLTVYQQTLGAMSGLEYCFGRFLPFLAEDVIPKQEKILLTQRKKGGNRKRKHGAQAHQFRSVVRVPQDIPVTRAALKFTGAIVSSIGGLLSAENYRDVSCLLVNLAVRGLITDNEALQTLFENLGHLGLKWNPGFTSPLRLSLHVLQSATLHPNPGVAESATRVMSQLTPLLHPSSPSLYVPVIQENEMRRLVAKLLVNDEEEEEESLAEGENMEVDHNTVSTTEPMEAEDDARVSKSSLTLPIPPTLTKDTEQPKQFPQKQLKSKEPTQHQIQPKLQKSKSTPQTFKRGNPEKAGEKEEKADEILENMESLQSNIQKIQAAEESKRRKKVTTPTQSNDKLAPEEEQLDVSEMLKDFSDKLNENLLPDPWHADSD